MVDGVASPVHGRAVGEVADVVHEQGAGQRRAWHVRVGADTLRMVDAVARPVHRSAIGQIANLTQHVGALERA